MFEKVNPCHPDKVADRIAGAIVDLAYSRQENPKIAVEVLIGHSKCLIIIESSLYFNDLESQTTIQRIVERIVNKPMPIVEIISVKQDIHLADNQSKEIRCGDNGIFKGVPITLEQAELSNIAKYIYHHCSTDGKYILNKNNLIICQSHIDSKQMINYYKDWFQGYNITLNPLGDWRGGIEVDTGATNRKLGSDMGDSVTGGGLHGKDLSKADISVNIYAFLKAQETGKEVKLCCAIGEDTIDGKPYGEIVEIAREYIKKQGGFEKFAEYGLI